MISYSAIELGYTKSFICIGTMVLLKPEKGLLKEMTNMIESYISISSYDTNETGFGFKGCNSTSDEQAICRLFFFEKSVHSPTYQWSMISQEYNYIP